MADPTETVRRTMLATGQPQRDLEKAEGAAKGGAKWRWSTQEMAEEFAVQGSWSSPASVTAR
jgi:hypothetical protein